jgi:hypothetical protein
MNNKNIHHQPDYTGQSNDSRRLAELAQNEVVAEGEAEAVHEKKVKDEPVTWRSLPHRRQLVILTLARLSEPLVQTSLQVSRYLFSKLVLAKL